MRNPTRRQFLQMLAGSPALLAFRARGASDAPIRAGLILPAGHPDGDAVRAGAEMGAAEALRVATLMKSTFDLETVAVSNPGQAAREAQRMAEAGVAAIAGGVGGSYCAALAEAVPSLFLEIRARRDLRPQDGENSHLRITPRHEHYARALVHGLATRGLRRYAFLDGDPGLRWSARDAGLAEVAEEEAEVVFAREPGTSGDRLAAGMFLTGGPNAAYPVAWHHSLERYGAGELNERFRESTGRDMNENAWFGWMAVKIVIESALRKREIRSARVDGHKGVPLVFEEGVLKQPLYVVVHDEKNEIEVVYA